MHSQTGLGQEHAPPRDRLQPIPLGSRPVEKAPSSIPGAPPHRPNIPSPELRDRLRIADYPSLVERAELVRAGRRRQAQEALDFERATAEALRERLEVIVTE